jgi:hypothetical protein
MRIRNLAGQLIMTADKIEHPDPADTRNPDNHDANNPEIDLEFSPRKRNPIVSR